MKKFEVKAEWAGQMAFDVSLGSHRLRVDAPVEARGQDSGPKPPLLLLGAMMSCTGMDMVIMLSARKITWDNFHITCDALQEEKDPKVFREAHLHYHFSGEGLENYKDKFIRSIQQSKEKYCCVSIMLSQSFPITPYLHINAANIPLL